MLLTSSDAPVYSAASSLVDNTDEISRYDSSTARVSTLSFPLEALSKNTQSLYLPPRIPGGWPQREEIRCAQRDNPKPPVSLQKFARNNLCG